MHETQRARLVESGREETAAPAVLVSDPAFSAGSGCCHPQLPHLAPPGGRVRRYGALLVPSGSWTRLIGRSGVPRDRAVSARQGRRLCPPGGEQFLGVGLGSPEPRAGAPALERAWLLSR